MPSFTRQATPGPSSTSAESRDYPISTSDTKKRAGSEDVEDAGHTSKKIKVDGAPLSNLSMNAKNKKKKRNRKKKRSPVVVPQVEPKERVKSNSWAPSSKPTSVRKEETVVNKPLDDTKYTAQCNEKPPPKSINKGKGKARSNSPTSQVPTTFDSGAAVASGSGDLNDILPDSFDHASEIARLKQQLSSQDTIIQKHKIYVAQHQQALTCQICLDLMHKPFALAPCGHITCYNCLIRWFTAFRKPNAAGTANGNADPLSENVDEVQLIVNSAEARRGTYLRRRKTCPVCRAAVFQRPVEMWGIKAMVVTLVNSKLVELPAPVALQNSTGANINGEPNNDPWRYIFHPTDTARQGPPVQNHPDHDHMGMVDIEDGGIYRCMDCFHEIWEGVCSGCNRGYPGHERDDDDHDDDHDDDSDLDGVSWLGGHTALHFGQTLDDGEFDDEVEEEVESVHFWEDDENQNLYQHPIYPMQYLFLSGDEGMTDSEGEGENWGENFNPFRPAFLPPPVLGGIARIDEGSDEEQEDYGGSFIDDNEEEEEEEEEENKDDGPDLNELDASSDEEHRRPRRLPQARIQQRRRALVTSEDEESIIDLEDEANHIPTRHSTRRMVTGQRNPARKHAAILLTDDSRSSGEEHDDNEEEED